MVAEQIEAGASKGTRGKLRLDVVDNHHITWPLVSQWIDKTGQSARLLDANGWLSARQILVAAFDGEKVVGHLGFRVDPIRVNGKIILEAWIDSLRVEKPTTEPLLFGRAQAQARLLGCRSLRHEK